MIQRYLPEQKQDVELTVVNREEADQSVIEDGVNENIVVEQPKVSNSNPNQIEETANRRSTRPKIAPDQLSYKSLGIL